MADIFVNPFHEVFNIVTGSRSERKGYLHFGRKDDTLIRKLKTGV